MSNDQFLGVVKPFGNAYPLAMLEHSIGAKPLMIYLPYNDYESERLG